MSSRVTLMFAAGLVLVVLLSPTRAQRRRAGRVEPVEPEVLVGLADPVDRL